MIHRQMLFLLAVCTVAAAGATVTQAQQDAPDDEARIRKNIAAYLEAFRNRDADAMAALWTEDGEYLTPGGELIKGRAALKESFERNFEDNEDVRVELDDPSVRVPSPSVAVEEGTAYVIRPDAAPEVINYVAVHVKEAGEWKLDSLREADAPEPMAADQLQQLSWLLGRWVDQDDDSTVETTCKFTKHGNFITRSFRVSLQGEASLEGTQVIGWDPVKKTFRSWMFDTEGGFGEGTWNQQGDRWVVRTTQTLTDGSRASAINILQPQEDGSYIWQSTGRDVDGHPQPNLGPVTIVRQ